MERSVMERLSDESRADRTDILRDATDAGLMKIERSWRAWARARQLPPPGAWRIWLIMAGRGFGKTRAGAEWVRGLAETDGRMRIALVAATLAEGRQVMIEGESGLMSIASQGHRPVWRASQRRLTWPNGAEARLYTAEQPEMLRGPQHHVAWCDEVAKWANGEAVWDNLMMTLRLGEHPRVVATTTPRAVPLIRRLMKAKDVQVTRGRTRDNAAHLARGFVESIEAEHEGTRWGRQELDGELIEDAAGALWTRAMIEGCRVDVVPDLVRVVVGVDPSAGDGTGKGDACGIVVAGICAAGRGFVLADASVAGASPDGWARAVASAAERYGADRVIAEANQGGAMVRSVLHAASVGLPVTLVHASRGKVARAEPVAALYEQGRVAHVGAFPALEDEMCGLIAGGGYEGPGRSPDRADALVWAVTALMLGKKGEPGVRGL
ncbi:DNA-packaging protein [Sphingomonas sp. ID0503]|uniref:DNA-packaging protein n=1 Tax=Sphingomonas sp. ID0503 TaxID=3399691 RepID=UPI003AFA0680